MLKHFKKIRYKLVLAVILVLLITLTTVTVVTHKKSLSVIKDQSFALNTSLAKMGAEQFNTSASQINTIFQSIYLDEGFRSYLKSYAISSEHTNPIRYADQLKAVFLSRLSGRTDIYSIIYIDADGRLTYCTRDEAGYYADYKSCILPDGYVSLYSQSANWQSGLKTLPTAKHMPLRTKNDGKEPYVYSVARKILNTESHFEQVGVMFITVDLSECERMARSITADASALVYIADGDNAIIYDSSGLRTGDPLPVEMQQYFNSNLDSSKITIDHKSYVIAYSPVEGFHWKVITLVPEKVYAKEASSVSNSILSAAIVALIASVALTSFFSKIISHPLEQMEKLMNRVDSDYLDIRVPVKGQDEVARIGTSFNNLMDRLQKAIENEYLMEIRQKEATMRALQAQLNPHFLYNVLQSVSSMATVYEVPEISIMAQSLGNMLRYVIQSDSLSATVREEIMHIENYLAIQKIRFGKRLNYQLNVPEYVMNYTIPRVFLQPVVENAIIHGLENRQEQGNLYISIWLEGNMLQIEVSDDGCGITPTEMARIQKNLLKQGIPTKEHGIGLMNLKSRLDLLYGPEAELKIESEVDIGTSIIITVPTERG